MRWLAMLALVVGGQWSVANAAAQPLDLPDRAVDPRTSIAATASVVPDDTPTAMFIEGKYRQWYYNFTRPGSCVQCSIGSCGFDQNVPQAATLLWDTEYGPHEWHGSDPSRVAGYCNRRGIKAYNVTGRDTIEWMKWATRNNRGAAIGLWSSHFQTLMDFDPQTNTWYVFNNQTPKKIEAYGDAEFRRQHAASGHWCVILDYPPAPAPPRYTNWPGEGWTSVPPRRG